MRYLIVAAKFNQLITRSLCDAAVEQLQSAQVAKNDIEVIWVPGSFELPLVAKEAALTKKYAAIVCLGAVIKGETAHFDHVAGQAAAGIMKAGLDSGIPIIFGVLTTDTVEQALNRAGLKLRNKGAEAAATALEMVQTLARVRKQG